MKLSQTTGKKHTFFSMDREFIVRKKVTVSKPNNFGEALEDFCETMKGNVVNPTTSQIFIITSEAHKKQERYHSIIAKRSWIMKHSFPDLEIAVSFIYAMVQCPTKEYWGKLRIVLNYLNATKYDKRIIRSDNLLQIDTWIYAYHTVYISTQGYHSRVYVLWSWYYPW